MKKILGSIGIVLLIGGCASNNMVIDKKIKEVNTDKILMKRYHITTDSLVNFGKYYIFYTPGVNKMKVVFLDKNYKKVKSIELPDFFEVKKITVKNSKIYVLGTDEKTYYPQMLIFNKEGKLVEKITIPKKYALVKDLYVNNGKYYILIDVYKNGKSYSEIYSDKKLVRKFETNKSINGNYIFILDNDIYLIGTVKNENEDAFLANLSKGWIRYFDLGMDEKIENYDIDENKIILNLHSTDYMGYDSYNEVILDKDGKVIKNKCKIKFAPLPVRYRT